MLRSISSRLVRPAAKVALTSASRALIASPRRSSPLPSPFTTFLGVLVLTFPSFLLSLAVLSFPIAAFPSSSLLSTRLFSSSLTARREQDGELDVDPAYVSEELTEEVNDTTPFANLTGKVHPDTLKALTVSPFKFVNMSTVQDRVLNLLPELAGREEGHGPGEGGRRDLLVKVSS